MDPCSTFYFQKYLSKESDRPKKRRIEPNNEILHDLNHPDQVIEEEKLMNLLGMPKEKITDRLKKHMKNKIMTMIEKETEKKTESNDFVEQTSLFINFLFTNYGLKEMIVPGSGHAPIYEDIAFVE